MHVVIIGGSGRVAPTSSRLVEAGFDVTAISRGERQPYQPRGNRCARSPSTARRPRAGEFGPRVRALEPDIVIDMICFTLASAQHLVESLRGPAPAALRHDLDSRAERPGADHRSAAPPPVRRVRHPKGGHRGVPAGRSAARQHPGHGAPSGAHRGAGLGAAQPGGALQPTRVRAVGARRGDHPAQPGPGDGAPRPRRRCGPGVHGRDHPLEQRGRRRVSHRLARGAHPARLCRGDADWFGQPARLRFLPWDEWKATVAPEEAQATWEHIARSPNCSIDKARRLLGYQPRYSSLQAVQESVSWLIDHGQIAL